MGCFSCFGILRLCIRNQHWVVCGGLRGLLRIFCAPDGLTISDNTQSWLFNSANGNRGPTFISSVYIPNLMFLDNFTTPLCWWLTIEHKFFADRFVFWLNDEPSFSVPPTASIPFLIIFFPHYVPIKGTGLHLFSFCPEYIFPFNSNVTSTRGNSLLQDHVIGLEPLSSCTAPVCHY